VAATDPAKGTPVRPGTAVTLFVSLGPPTQGLPSVVGRDAKSAAQFLTQKGFTVRVGTPVHSPNVPKGLIAKTNPGPGSKVAPHSMVVLFPSGGPFSVTVPNVVNMSDADARKQLAKVGLALRVSQTIPNVNIPPQTIMDQEPNGGAQAPPGTAVVVEESGGPNALTVPNVVGGTIDDARSKLAQAGLSIGTVAQIADASTTPGTVVSQNPQAGSQTGAGASVDLYVAVAPAGATGAPAPGSAAPVPQIPNVIGMSVDDAKAALAKAGYTVDHVTVLPNSPPDAKVVNTEPEVGATAPPGVTKVNLIVGPPGH
jgi:serine/threonine-protein kinase